MRQLTAPTEDFIKLERSRLKTGAAQGSNVTLVLENNDGLASGDFIVIGYEGSELCEIQQINQAVTPGTDVRVATLKFTHEANEPITKYAYNKRKFYGSLTEGGSYVELTADGSPVSIQVDDPMGTHLEYTGSEDRAKTEMNRLREAGNYSRIICGYHQTIQHTKFFTIIYKLKHGK